MFIAVSQGNFLPLTFTFTSRVKTFAASLDPALKPRTTVLSGLSPAVTVHKTHSSRAPDVVSQEAFRGLISD